MSILSNSVETSANSHRDDSESFREDLGTDSREPESKKPDSGGDAGKPLGTSSVDRRGPTRWVWNLPLLLISLAVIGVGAPVLVGLYYWQSTRIGVQLLQLAELAAADEKPAEQARWLRRYLAIRPHDVDVQVSLAWVTDGNTDDQQWTEVDQSRRNLTRALTAVDGQGDVATEDALRRRLIERLLQLGGGWFIEAEREIIKLNPAPEDPQALEQLARSLMGQDANQVPRPFKSQTPQREEHFWRWAANQPLGELLRMAVQANPDSVELSAELIRAYLDRPELFASEGESIRAVGQASKQEFAEQASRLLQRLSERQDDGYAQWTAIYYAGRDNVSVQPQPLAVVAAGALGRLQEHAKSWASTNETEGPDETNGLDQSETVGGTKRSSDYQPFWDGQLVLTHAGNLATAQAFEAARENYEALVQLPDGVLINRQLELGLLGLGHALWQSDQHDAARQTWQAGNERLGGASLLLLQPLAANSAQSAPIDQARQDIKRLADAIQTASSRLAARSNLIPIQREELQTQLNAATWRIDVLRAQVDYREGKHLQAAQRLERALASQLTVETRLRLEASDLLASVYGEQNMWDLAGRVLDEAALSVPGDRALRRRAAAAWQRASAAPRAAEQWQRADDGSFESGLAYAGAVASSLAVKPPANRDLKPLVAAINEAQQRLDQATDRGHSPADAWRLALLRLSLPAEMRSIRPATDAGTTTGPETVPEAADMTPEIRELIDLSLQYPGTAQLQAVTALSLQSSGNAAAADEAVQRLTSITEVDPLVVLEVQVRLAVQRGDVDGSVKLLRDASAQSESANRRDVTQFAAKFLRSLGRQQEAIELLMQLDPEQHNSDSLLQLGELLLGFRQPQEPRENAAAELAAAEMDVPAELQKIEAALRQTEGDEGTHWRLLTAQRLLHESGIDAAERRRRLTQAAILQSEIASRRPRWSRTLVLGGQIAAIQGDTRRAVDQLRRAIAEGDKQATTVLLLVKQLNRLGEVAAAEQELGRLESLADSVGEISVMSVGLALGQQNYDSALQRARAGVAARPRDSEALMVLAQAAAVVARTDEEQAESLRDEADEALRQALELTRGRDLGVWQAQFRLQAETGGQAAAREVLEAMQQSGLADSAKFLAVANGYSALQDWDQAQAWLEKAKQQSPTDVGVVLAQSILFRATNQHEAMINALEEANRLAPDREDVRRQLALSLAANSSNDVPWDRISQLVGAERQGGAQTDQLYHALILISRGGDRQIEQARGLLDNLMLANDTAIADDAARLLLSVERSRWEASSADGDQDQANAALADCRRLYEPLVNRRAPSPRDLYNFGELLLRADQASEAKAIADRLSSIAPASRAALELRVRLAKHSGKESELRSIIDAWLKQPDNGKSFEAYSAVGQLLASLGLVEYSVELFSDAYRDDPAQLRNFIVALAQTEDFDRAVAVCVEHFRKEPSPESASLLADIIVQGLALSLVDDTVEDLLADAIKEFPSSIQLLEAIGTLRLTQQRYADAASLFAKSEKLNPISLVTLNNMAVALAEIPGRHGDALARIERAIELYGRDPELLDTLGIVQLQGNLLSDAEATLREAYAQSNDAMHLFHLLQVLDASNQTAELEQLWKQLDLTQLNVRILSLRDQSQLENLRERLGIPSA